MARELLRVHRVTVVAHSGQSSQLTPDANDRDAFLPTVDYWLRGTSILLISRDYITRCKKAGPDCEITESS